MGSDNGRHSGNGKVRVTWTKDVYDAVVYPAMAVMPPVSRVDNRLGARVLDMLEEHGRGAPVTLQELAAGKCPLYTLIGDVLVIDLEPAEVAVVALRLDAYIHHVAGTLSRHVGRVLDDLEALGAPTE